MKAINDAAREGIFFLGVTSDMTRADGYSFLASSFMHHDYGHFAVALDGFLKNRAEFNALFDRFRAFTQGLSPRDQKVMETLWFYATHERFSSSPTTIQAMWKNLDVKLEEKFVFGLGPDRSYLMDFQNPDNLGSTIQDPTISAEEIRRAIRRLSAALE